MTALRAKSVKTLLGYFFGPLMVAAHLSKRCGINQIQMPAHQFSKGVFGMRDRITTKQFSIFDHVHFK